MLKVGIVGASGYTGIELIRLLDQHPEVTITKVYSHSTKGQSLSAIYPYLQQKYPLMLEEFQPAQCADLDIIFLALPHGQTHAIVPELLKHSKLKIIDLSADFRIKDAAIYEKFYKVNHQAPQLLNKIPLGFPEIRRAEIAKAQACANPGCYATSVILGLYPLAKAGLLTQGVLVDSKSGVTGAGRSLKETSLYCEANEAISAYQTGVHRHIPEMEEALSCKVFFSPHLTPMNRGILSAMYLDNPQNLSKADITAIYQKQYANEPFIQLLDINMPSTKMVRGTNNCAITIQVFENKIVIFSAIDNLIKGASGQAVQNMNLMCGFPETLSLTALAPYI